jgi:hypothetical protein
MRRAGKARMPAMPCGIAGIRNADSGRWWAIWAAL